ncbi:unnamed protein product, partial [Rotaria sordida]
RRCNHIFTNLEQLINYATRIKSTVTFMSRNYIRDYYQDPNSSKWTNKNYPQAAIFPVQCVHHSSDQSHHNGRVNSDYLICLDKDSYDVSLKISHSDCFSLITTSIDQQQNQIERFLHSTHTHNIAQLIQHLKLNKNNTNYIHLVCDSVPYNYICQYLQFARQHTYDVLRS